MNLVEWRLKDSRNTYYMHNASITLTLAMLCLTAATVRAPREKPRGFPFEVSKITCIEVHNRYTGSFSIPRFKIQAESARRLFIQAVSPAMPDDDSRVLVDYFAPNEDGDSIHAVIHYRDGRQVVLRFIEGDKGPLRFTINGKGFTRGTAGESAAEDHERVYGARCEWIFETLALTQLLRNIARQQGELID